MVNLIVGIVGAICGLISGFFGGFAYKSHCVKIKQRIEGNGNIQFVEGVDNEEKNRTNDKRR